MMYVDFDEVPEVILIGILIMVREICVKLLRIRCHSF